MKKIIFLSIFAIFAIFACNKNIEEPTKDAYVAADLDTKAGAWKTMILATPTDVTIADPKDISSAEYKAEIDKLKATIAALTSEEKTAVTYWGAGSVYRWNEIARELCAKYNLAPAANADGTYPVPNADSTKKNPNYYPKFPFANPPYAARALAYLSVAQYDALVATGHYKAKYNRSAVSKNDASVATLLPVSDAPTYPSESAVVAAASYTVLVAMFPGEVPYLNTKLAEAQNVRYWAGMNVDRRASCRERVLMPV